MRITDKAIYIDREMKKEKFDEETCYKYICDIISSLAWKKKFFPDPQYYEGFVSYAGAVIYMRMLGKTILEPRKRKDGTVAPLKPVKSVLNYIKTVMYGLKDVYSRQEYKEVINTDMMWHGKELGYALEDYIKQPLLENTRTMNKFYIEEFLKAFPKALKVAAKQTMYANDKQLYHNIYTSLLLSFINRYTLKYQDNIRLEQIKSQTTSIDEPLYAKAYNNTLKKIYSEKSRSYDLPEDISLLVEMLYKDVSAKLYKEMKEMIDSMQLSDEEIDSAIYGSLGLGNEGDIDD